MMTAVTAVIIFRVLGYCNYEDVCKLQNVVKGMQIKGKVDKSKLSCDICTQGKCVQTRNRKPDTRAKSALKLVHADLAAPVNPVAEDGFRYMLVYTTTPS